MYNSKRGFGDTAAGTSWNLSIILGNVTTRPAVSSASK